MKAVLHVLPCFQEDKQMSFFLRWIDRDGFVAWPPRLPDLTPLAHPTPLNSPEGFRYIILATCQSNSSDCETIENVLIAWNYGCECV